jgi:orotate phosphoribosyltransferase
LVIEMSNIKDSLVRCSAILYGDFTLASGKKSKYYIDIKKAITDPIILEEVADEMAHIIERDDIEVDRIAGVVLGSVPLAVALSLRTGIPFIMIRKEPKDHGTGKLIEGALDKGMKVLVVEDVVTSAGSAAYAIEVLRQAGAEVGHVLSVVDREEGGREKLESMSTKLHALVTASDVLGQR